MKGGRWAFLGRLLLAVAGALLLIVGLELRLRRVTPAASRSLPPAPVPAADPAGADQEALGDLRVVARSLAVCSQLSACPAAAAPVVQVLDDGEIVVRRPPPLPSGPAAVPVELAGLLLPAPGLANLTPVQRGAVLAVVGRLLPERPLSPGRLRLCGVAGSPADLSMLLAWLR